MKLPALFLLLGLAFHNAESQTQISMPSKDEKVVCINKENALKVLKGRDGPPGKKGVKGEEGQPGYDGVSGPKGDTGIDGLKGQPGPAGKKGVRGMSGFTGYPGSDGYSGPKGERGDDGADGENGDDGRHGPVGPPGTEGERGPDGLPGAEIKDDILVTLLNDFYVAESGYYSNLYHVTSRDLTDGRTDTGGWGSETAKTGNYIQASYVRPVYVTSVTVAGGFIPSWNHEIKQGYGLMDLEYSTDGKTWNKIIKIKTPEYNKMVTYHLAVGITAQYWRLVSTENKWVGTTEFKLKPLTVA